MRMQLLASNSYGDHYGLPSTAVLYLSNFGEMCWVEVKTQCASSVDSNQEKKSIQTWWSAMNAVASKQKQILRTLCKRIGEPYFEKQSFAKHAQYSTIAFQLLLLFVVMVLSVRVRQYQSITLLANSGWNGKPRKPTESCSSRTKENVKKRKNRLLAQSRHTSNVHMMIMTSWQVGCAFEVLWDGEEMFDSDLRTI